MSKQNYTIFINQTAIVLTKSPQNYPSVIDVSMVLKLVKKFQHKMSAHKVELRVSCPIKTLFLLKKQLGFVVAAGGIIESNNQFLYIKRNGFWDLPKGKVEPKETIAQAAVREVSEECGIPLPIITQNIGVSYHIYKMRKKWVLKETHWYMMEFAEKVETFRPQAIEGITEVAFFDKDFLLKPDVLTYQNLKELIRRII